MKNIVLLGCITLMTSASAFAAGPFKSAGCGLGSMVIKEEGTMQIFAATLNGTSGTQTFGISSGTSNCETAGGIATTETEANMYVSSNHDAITQEMAQGSGEHLKALSSLLGCDQSHSERFAKLLKKHYRSINSKSPETLLNNVKNTVSADPVLKTSCSL